MFIKALGNWFYQWLRSKVESTSIQCLWNKLISFCLIFLITIIINSLTNTAKNNNKQSQIIKKRTHCNLNNLYPKRILETKKTKWIIIKNTRILINLKNPKIHLNSLRQPILQPLLFLNQLIIMFQSLPQLIINLFDKFIISRFPFNLSLRLLILLIFNIDKLFFIFFRRV